MTTRDDAWPDGAPCWVALAVEDPDAAAAFYTGLFGWDVEDGTCLLGGRIVAGIERRQRQPFGWTTYLASADAAATADGIAAAGGTVLVPPFDVPGRGRAAVGADDQGAVFGVWQARGGIGVEVANEPGALQWNEIMSRDPGRARTFYGTVFGLRYDDVPGDAHYSIAKAGDRPVGAVGALTTDEPAHWTSYFRVADCAAACVAVTELGGRVHEPAEDTPYGRLARVAGDQGAVFSLIEDT